MASETDKFVEAGVRVVGALSRPETTHILLNINVVASRAAPRLRRVTRESAVLGHLLVLARVEGL